MSSSVLAQLKPFTLNSRSLFVKCVPAPRNFYERRAVLAALQKSSQDSIETFKKLQDSSSFIVVTTKPDAATSLIHDSPLERTIISQGSGSDGVPTQSAWGSDYDVRGPVTTPVNPLPASATVRPTPVSINLGLSHHTFTLHIFPANKDYDHREEIRKNPLHGQWPGDGKTETFVSSALRRVIPPGVMAPALRDWESGNQLASDSDSFAGDGPEGAASMILGKKRHSAAETFLLERIRRREAERETPPVMNSLMEFSRRCRANTIKARSEPLQNTEPRASQTEAPESPFDTGSAPKPKPLLDDAEFKKLLEE
ncbi:hypothetical protein GQX73_g3998 [Xylaria multiplex]|uniref:Uncharacterized protein n=1 Tax=Xylaria multiplex TaxID=323545 RepID=A0A7C8IQ93_9PEZI|nr:hypothetical protein GQX73_g3998 [Xylaria multiplex]